MGGEQNGGRPLHRTRVIAQVGENHVGDLDLARRMVVEACAAGANVIAFRSDRRVDAAGDGPQREWLERVSLSDAAHHDLAALASAKGAAFMGAPSTVETARFLVEELGLRSIKVASQEMLNFPLLEYLAGNAHTVYLSTGLAALDEVAIAVSRLKSVQELVIMHCVAQYPLSEAEANLRAISTLADAFPGRQVGYSDHTIGLLAPILAVALGARAIEKHFTLDRSLPGADHVMSVTPSELSELVHGIRQAELMLGSGQKHSAAPGIHELLRPRSRKA